MYKRFLVLSLAVVYSFVWAVFCVENCANAVNRVYSLGTVPVAATVSGECSFIEGRWRPGSVRAEGFYPFEIVVQNTKKAIKKAKGERKRSLEAKLSRQRRTLKTRIKACSTLPAPVSTSVPNNPSPSQPPGVVVDNNAQFRLVEAYFENLTSELIVTFEVINKDTTKSVLNIREGALTLGDGSVKKSDALAYISNSRLVRSFATNSSLPLDGPANTPVLFSYVFSVDGQSAQPNSVLVNGETSLRVTSLTLTTSPSFRVTPFTRSTSDLSFVLAGTNFNAANNELTVFYDVENFDSARSSNAFSKSTMSDTSGVSYTSTAFILPTGQTQSFTGRSSITAGTPFGTPVRIGYVFLLQGPTNLLSTLVAENDVRLGLVRVPVPYNR